MLAAFPPLLPPFSTDVKWYHYHIVPWGGEITGSSDSSILRRVGGLSCHLHIQNDTPWLLCAKVS